MAPPAVTIYVTSLTSQPKVRQHIELLRRSLKGLEIPYEEFDLVIDEDAKKRWQRSKPPGQVIGLPGYLVGGEWVGTMDDFEEAVETQTLPQFLKQDLDLSSTTLSSAGSDQASSTADGSLPSQKSVQEVELEKLMRDMTDDDLDKLMSQLGVDASSTKIGLLDGESAVGDVKDTEKGLLADLKKEAELDEKEDKEVQENTAQAFDSKATVVGSSISTGSDGGQVSGPGASILDKGGLGEGEGLKAFIPEGDSINPLDELKKELEADKKETDDIVGALGKAKID
ncbi:hypothetical protein IAU60_002371 [Kwoniella sp. DSM 27419]